MLNERNFEKTYLPKVLIIVTFVGIIAVIVLNLLPNRESAIPFKQNKPKAQPSITESAKIPEKGNQNTSTTTNNSELNKPRIIFNGSRNQKQLALTFDADMTPFMKKELETKKIKTFYNKEVIDLLIKYNLPATLFLTGMWTEIYPDVAKELAQNPLFEIENHSYSHPSFVDQGCFGLATSTKEQRQEEIKKSQEIILKYTGVKTKYFRFPGGCYDDDSLNLVKKANMTTVQWDAVSGDAFLKDGRKIADLTEQRVKNGSIIVMHMNGGPHTPSSADALKYLLPELIKQGYTFVKIENLTFDND